MPEASTSEAITALPTIVAQLDEHYRIRFASDGHWNWFGVPPAHQLGCHIREIIGQQAFITLEPRFSTALSGSQTTFHGEVPYAHCGRRFVHSVYTPHPFGQGMGSGIQMVVSDLTPYHSIRKQLADETLRSQTIVQHAIDGIITINQRGIIQSFNPAAERLFGYRAHEAIGHNIAILMPEPDRGLHDGYIQHYQRTHQPRVIGTGRDVTAIRRDGSLIEIRLAVAEFFLDREQHFVGFIHDLSSRKWAEREALEARDNLAHANRITAMGELTAGIAHEISQPLTAVQVTAQACRSMLMSGNPDPTLLAEALEQITTQSQRTTTIVQELRDFVRKGDPGQLSWHTPESLIDNVIPLLSHELQRAEVNLSCQHEKPLCDCMVNRVQIEQVLFNILRNAIEAMDGSDAVRDLRVQSRLRPDGQSCEIDIEDTGPGIPAEHLNRLFDPFFTTKTNGMGQGLAICKSIIEHHGGKLMVESPDGGGALFRIVLPRRHHAAEAIDDD
ncbi:MAG: two-component system sensor histidine kinase NtrB [Pseudomonadota bacterium]